MNKGELVDLIYEDINRVISKKDITVIVSNLFGAIQEAVANGDKVTIVDFGSFEPRDRAAREGRNPKTGEKMKIAATRIPAFSAGKGFKEAVVNG